MYFDSPGLHYQLHELQKEGNTTKDRLLTLLLPAVLFAGPLPASQPDLVLLVVVDQLRADMPWRLQERLVPAGFRYLTENGAVYTNAHYQHLVTTTAAGHATLVTGGNVPQHGIAANEWFDRDTRETVYSTADTRHPETGAAQGSEGRSPRNLTSSTLGDELIEASGGGSRVFSVSIKDRSAVVLAGRLGKAHWYSRSTGRFVSSSYYYDPLPEWMQRWNETGHADRYQDESWELLEDSARYALRDQDDRPFEKSYGNMGRVFPHLLGNFDRAVFYSTLRHSPMGDELTLAFARELAVQENVGESGYTDVLAISFSATDYIGHAFGPNSLEAEDNLLRLDRTLQELFQFVDERVGLDRTLVVLASDHGVSAAPEHLSTLGIPAGRHDAPAFMRAINSSLQKRFHTRRLLALSFKPPGIYLDTEVIRNLGLEQEAVERTVADEIMRLPGFMLAQTRSDILADRVPDSPAARRVRAGFHPQRSGDVIVLQDAFWYLASEPHGDTAMHGSPWTYDHHVPIMIAGPGIRAGRIGDRVAVRDLAPTISAYLGIPAPSGSIGKPLPMVSGETLAKEAPRQSQGPKETP